MIVYPAVDIARGRCVRLLRGDPDTEHVYYDVPAEAAAYWQNQGGRALHVVDLDGALATGENPGPVRQILDRLQIPVQVAGGLRTTDAVRRVLEQGAARAVVGTQAAREPQWAVGLCRMFPDRIVVAVDALEGRVAIEGWQELAETGPVELARTLAEGPPAAFLYTDVSRDGTLTRPHFEGVEALLDGVDVPVIASGGVSSLDDIRRLGDCGADAVVIGKALYERRFTLAEACEAAEGFPTRLKPAPADDT